jgi:peptide/nickel transport system permease protein
MSSVLSSADQAGGLQADDAADRPLRRRRPWGLWLSGGAVAFWLAMAALGRTLVANPAVNLTQRLLTPGSPGHILGTDGEGRDVLHRLVDGAQPSILAGLIPVLIAGALGTFLGVTAAQARSRTHALIMRVLDVFFAFPAVLLAIGIAAALGGGLLDLIISLTVVLVPAVARVAEVETLRLRGQDFLESARASGARGIVISVRHVLPNVGPALIAYCTTLVGLAVVYAAGLSYLGLGVAPPQAEWGSMLNDLQQNIFTKPALALIPALVLFLVSISFNTFGNALRRALDVQEGTL